MRIEVTQVDIENGETRSPVYCPVALAMKRYTGHKWHVGDDEVEDMESYRTVMLSDEAIEFINDFDNGDSVKPFAFDLEI